MITYNEPPKNYIETHRGGISFQTSNLLDEQIMMALKDVLLNNKINHIELLQHLQKLNRTGVIELQKKAA